MNESMKRMKAAELDGKALDWAVAQIEIKAGHITDDTERHELPLLKHGLLFPIGIEQKGTFNQKTGKPWFFRGPSSGPWSPSTRWGVGGPFISGHLISIHAHLGEPTCCWVATRGRVYAHGDTPLIAAMRCYVMAMMGDEVEVPGALL